MKPINIILTIITLVGLLYCLPILIYMAFHDDEVYLHKNKFKIIFIINLLFFMFFVYNFSKLDLF